MRSAALGVLRSERPDYTRTRTLRMRMGHSCRTSGQTIRRLDSRVPSLAGESARGATDDTRVHALMCGIAPRALAGVRGGGGGGGRSGGGGGGGGRDLGGPTRGGGDGCGGAVVRRSCARGLARGPSLGRSDGALCREACRSPCLRIRGGAVAGIDRDLQRVSRDAPFDSEVGSDGYGERGDSSAVDIVGFAHIAGLRSTSRPVRAGSFLPGGVSRTSWGPTALASFRHSDQGRGREWLCR